MDVPLFQEPKPGPPPATVSPPEPVPEEREHSGGWRHRQPIPETGEKCIWYTDIDKKIACGEQAEFYVTARTRVLQPGVRVPVCFDHKAEYDETMFALRTKPASS